jgi:hypothetical protein
VPGDAYHGWCGAAGTTLLADLAARHLVAAGGEHHDDGGRVGHPEPAAHLDAVEIGKAQIQQYQVETDVRRRPARSDVAQCGGRFGVGEVAQGEPEVPRNSPASGAVLTGLIGPGGGRRAFVDATGAPVVVPPVIRRVVATDERIARLLRELGAPLVGCAGAAVDVARLRPDVIVTGAGDRTVEALRSVAPVVAVALLGTVVGVVSLQPSRCPTAASAHPR